MLSCKMKVGMKIGQLKNLKELLKRETTTPVNPGSITEWMLYLPVYLLE